MMHNTASLMLLTLLVGTPLAATPEQQDMRSVGATRWFKGNTHTHSLNSDGDSSPEDVARWYREHGYHFVVFTDHEFITPVDGLNAVIGAMVMSGQEVTGRFGNLPVHANGLGLTKVVMPRTGDSPLDVLQKDVAAIREAGALPQINHPNFGWALTGAELSKIEGPALLEIWNGHPMVNTLGGGGVPSAESMWDEALTAGRRLFAVADDDAHHFKRLDDPAAAAPNRGWVVVRSGALTQAAIMDAMRRHVVQQVSRPVHRRGRTLAGRSDRAHRRIHLQGRRAVRPGARPRVQWKDGVDPASLPER